MRTLPYAEISKTRGTAWRPGHRLQAAALVFLLAVAVSPGPTYAQNRTETAAESERKLVETIEQIRSQNGPDSGELIEPLATLSLLYEAKRDAGNADATIERLLEVVDTNDGLPSFALAPTFRRLIDHVQARGNSRAAWQLEEELLRLAVKNANNMGVAQIYIDTADRLLDVLNRYESGELPDEIELGCYYVVGYRAQTRGGSQPTLVAGEYVTGCQSGSHRRARASLLGEIQSLYSSGVTAILDAAGYGSDELLHPLTELARLSYRYARFAPGRYALEQLVDHTDATVEAWAQRIEARAQIGDWDLLFSRYLGTQLRNDALQTYADTYALARQHSVPQTAIDEVFAPARPVILPTFIPNGFAAAGRQNMEYVDLALIVTADGKSDQIEVLDTSPGVTRTKSKMVVQRIRRSRFRPRLTDDGFVDTPPLTARYYLDD